MALNFLSPNKGVVGLDIGSSYIKAAEVRSRKGRYELVSLGMEQLAPDCIVDVDAFALQNVYEVNYAPTTRTTVALLDIGASIMTINIVQGQDFLFTRDVGVGGNQYTDFLQKEFHLGFAQAQALKHGDVSE